MSGFSVKFMLIGWDMKLNVSRALSITALSMWICSVLILACSSVLADRPLFDIASLAAFPAAIGIFVVTPLLIVRFRSALARVGLILCLVPAFLVLVGGSAQAPSCQGMKPDLKVAWLNARNPVAAEPIAQWIASERPQIVGMAEVGPQSAALRGYLEGRYHNWHSCLDNGRCSTVLYSVLPPLGAKALARGDPENRRALSAVRMTFAGPVHGDPVDVIALHLSRPLPLGRQSAELAEADEALGPSADTIVMGDFNMSPRMHVLRSFAARNGLAIARTPAPTWPTTLRGRKIGGLWQIDQLLLGRGWKVAKIKRSPDLGSDHFGYVAYLCHNGAV